MSNLNISLNPKGAPLRFYAGAPTYNPTITLEGTVRALRLNPGGTVLPSPIPPDGTQPPIPGNLSPVPGYTPEPFNYLVLPRLQNQVSDTILTSVDRTTFEVNPGDGWIDLSDFFVAGDYSMPISGAAIGTATLAELANNPRLNSLQIDYGTRFRWLQCWGDTCLEVASGFIVASPIYNQESDGAHVLKLNLGDELALKADTSRVPTRRYCGRPPKTAGEAARLFAEYHSLFTRSYPPGHPLLDREAQSFVNERPYDYLQALYAPTGQDVRCNSNGIIVVPRPVYFEPSAVTLSPSQVIEVEPSFSQTYEPVTKAKVANNYTLLEDFRLERTVKVTVAGLATNTKPWFHGGYTTTTTTTVTLGDTPVWSEEVTWGYVPTATTLTQAQIQEDPCQPSAIATVWGQVSRKVLNVAYYEHTSGAYLVNRSETWLNGKKLRQLPSSSYEIFDGLQEYTLEEFENTPQINNEVCSKDYIHAQTWSRIRRFGLTEEFTYILLEEVDTRYRVEGANPGQLTTYVGLGQAWTQVISRGAYDSREKVFITQPQEVNPGTDPPQAKWIRPVQRQVIAFTETSLEAPGSVEVKPLQAPFCYTQGQLEAYAIRYLRETYGLARGLTLVVPYYINVTLGDSVKYQGKPYLVFNVEINQTGPEATRTILCAAWEP